MAELNYSNLGGKLQTLIEIFSKVFAQLGISESPEIIEALSITVHKVLTGKSRLYHSIDHAFDLLDPEDPFQSIAALYHDLVHYHADLGYSPEIEQGITPYLTSRSEPVTLIADVPPGDQAFLLTLGVFGFRPGQVLDPDYGLNEFLSALFMNLQLQPYLTDAALLRITVCIEATIPFREKNYFYTVAERIYKLNLSLGVGLSANEVTEMIKAAITFANRDVKDFADPEISALINNTWKLLPEQNSALRKGIYTIGEYCQALLKVENFMGSLRAEAIFHQFEETPAQEVYLQMLGFARANLSAALNYLQIKLLSAVVLYALAEISGGDAPLSLLLGDITPNERTKRIGDFLPEPDMGAFWVTEPKVNNLFQYDYDFYVDLDLRNVPLSLFIYQNLSQGNIGKRIEDARQYLAGKITALEFLTGCKSTTVSMIARAIAAIVPTRRGKLLDFVCSLPVE